MIPPTFKKLSQALGPLFHISKVSLHQFLQPLCLACVQPPTVLRRAQAVHKLTFLLLLSFKTYSESSTGFQLCLISEKAEVK